MASHSDIVDKMIKINNKLNVEQLVALDNNVKELIKTAAESNCEYPDNPSPEDSSKQRNYEDSILHLLLEINKYPEPNIIGLALYLNGLTVDELVEIVEITRKNQVDIGNIDKSIPLALANLGQQTPQGMKKRVLEIVSAKDKTGDNVSPVTMFGKARDKIFKNIRKLACEIQEIKIDGLTNQNYAQQVLNVVSQAKGESGVHSREFNSICKNIEEHLSLFIQEDIQEELDMGASIA